MTRFHLAGIVPVASTLKSDYGMLWPDVLTPLAPNYTMIENAILTAAYAGCESIWVVMDTKTILLFKEILGDWVRDPSYGDNLLRQQFIEREKRIPIIYVPVRPIDFKKRESIPWSIITGVLSAYKTMYNLSRWVTSDAYFVSFPYGIVDHKIIKENRRKISSKNRFYCSYKGKTIKDGEYLPFTFFLKDFINYKVRFKENSTGRYVKDDGGSDLQDLKQRVSLPFEERYSGRYLGIKDVFDVAEISQEDTIADLDWFHDVSSWNGYRNFMGDEKTNFIQRPSKRIFPLVRYRKWLPMGMDEYIEYKKEDMKKEEENVY